MRLATYVLLLAAVPSGSAAQSPAQPSDPIVQVGLYGYDADGRHSAAAYETPPELKSTVYLNRARCVFGAGNSPAPADATDVWQFSGKVVSATSEQAIVQLDWRRMVVQGHPTDGNQASQQLTLHAGEIVQLDQAGIDSRTPCATGSVAFEARYTPRFFGMGQISGGMRGGIARSGATVGNVSVVTRPAGGSGMSGGASQPAAGATYEVDLWLVRSLPGKPNEVNHSVLRINESGGSFTFAPITVPTNSGSAVVFVGGLLRVVRNSNGEDQLLFTTSRRVMTSGSDVPPPGNRPDSVGSTRIIDRMPGPEEVLSFEMPPITLNGQPVAPDQLSVRLKIKPR